ncbi:hypothetical protein [Terrimonas ferruginea]|uniref:hypothetical protein n=1 Tax=Terrimonas ferruginea TaxID=249 RepID=UPI00048ACBD3|nr:hypothetical protein [Terrimonas ferruginea]
MYQTLIFLHSILRWLVLLSLVIAVCRAARGYYRGKMFTAVDNAVRHWTATIGHLQLMAGLVLYFQSPLVSFFLKNFDTAQHSFDLVFFGMIHSLLMFVAIVVLTLGSALSKRRLADKSKFRTMLLWYAAALLIIFIAIPWPFSPFVHRPYFR